MIGDSRLVTTKTATVSSTAISLVTFGFSAAVVQSADKIIIGVEAGALRVTYDTDLANPPTVSAGLKIPTNNYPFWIIYGRPNASNMKLIRDGSSDATVTIVIESN